jgi:hypothetical protein
MAFPASPTGSGYMAGCCRGRICWRSAALGHSTGSRARLRTPGIGAMQAGWDEVVGIEREAEYVEIARRRAEYWTGQREPEPTMRQQELIELE